MSSAAAHLVVVDDEPDIRATLQEYLQLAGYRVSTAAGGGELREILAREHVDLVVLDLRMPGEDGLSIARRLRETTEVAVVMLTAAGEVIDRIVGLEVGADDYLAKPVDLRELQARLKAVLRRGRLRAPAGTAPAARATASGPANEVWFGSVRLDLDAHALYDAAGDEIRLTAMEFDLLSAFAEHPNRALSRDQLLDLAHNRNREPYDRSIDLRIARIRRKIELDPKHPQVIRTVPGTGYIFVARKSVPAA